jgi:ornithine carbamoyltransferase
MQQFLDLADFSRDQLVELLALAARLRRTPEPQALAGKVLGLLFMNPSLRTLSSFQSGMLRLGGAAIVVTPGQGSWQFETRVGAVMNAGAAEHVREAIPVLASYVDALGIRMFAQGRNLEADLADREFLAMAELSPRPVINMESAAGHPCQALADWYTLDELAVPRRARFVLSWVNHPRALPLAVPASTVHMAAMRGMDVVVLRPEGFELPEPVMARARRAAEVSGGTVTETSDRQAALRDAHVLYAKEWGTTRAYGDADVDANLRAGLADWCVDPRWFATAHEECRFMHCLPVRRNVAVTDAVLDGPRSVVVQEAHNRMVVQMAILHRLLRG